MKRALTIVVLSACAVLSHPQTAACVNDSDCDGGMVCFADGCGDPGSGIVVEVTGSTSTGLLPQDFALGDAGVTATMSFEVAGPIGIEGQMSEGGPGNLVTYHSQVTIRAKGESELIPGLVRNYEVSFPDLMMTMGFYKMNLAAGRYDVTAFPAMNSTFPFPPQVVPGVKVESPTIQAYELPPVPFTFPSIDQCVYVDGTLVEYTRAGSTKLAESAMQIQAFDPATHRPLSQVVDVGMLTGDFTVYVDPTASDTLSLIATPRDSTALAPTKTFVVSVPNAAQRSVKGLKLELGDYGMGLPQVPGTLVGSDGGPIPGAVVVVSGVVGGGGTFTSQRTTSAADGGFALDLLASEANNSLVLTAYPPADSASGIVQVAVGAALVGTSGTLTPGTITAPDRLIVSGRLLRPDGQTPLDGATVIATPSDTLDGHPMPLGPSQTLTDLAGRYQLSLDPALYRLDYLPGEQLPLKSRVVRVESAVDVDAGSFVNTLDLGDFALSTGRTVTGSVAVRAPTDPPGSGTPAANALVRYFRVTSVEGQASSQLIGQAVTDGTGSYQLILPNHPSATVAVDAGQLDAGSPDGG